MNAGDVLAAVDAGEDQDWEFKAAKGGLPKSLWETYSAMANTDGGVIILGVRQRDDGQFQIQGLDDPATMERDFWNTIGNRGKVSANLLSGHDVSTVRIGGKALLVIRVPRATRRQRPVYVGQNPLEGTFRRFGEGDYRCSRDEVGRMLADQSDQPADSEVLPDFGIEDLDPQTLQQFRHRFASRSPTHPWLKEDDRSLLEKLGGWRSDRTTGRTGLTVAGLLMFGKDAAIRDPAAVPQYHVDYRERFSDDLQVRWTDRIWLDGTWVGNLFQFFERVYPRLVRDLKIPFQLTDPEESGPIQRHDETIVHEAIREALVNALIHADYRGQGGIVVERFRDRLELSNPGTLLLGMDQILKGSVSECRNKTLQSMFAMLGYGEKAGSGIDKIRQGWASQNWRLPRLEETIRPDRVRLVLPMVSLLPGESVERIQARFGSQLSPLEIHALVTAELEGAVSNGRLRQVCGEHPAELTKLLQGLVGRGFLWQEGHGRGTTYHLPDPETGDSSHKAEDSSHKAEDSSHKAGDSSHKAEDSSHKAGDSSHKRRKTPHIEAEDSSHKAGDSSHKAEDSSHKRRRTPHIEAEDSSHKAGDSSHKAGDSSHSGAATEEERSEEDLAAIRELVSARSTSRMSADAVRELISELCRGRYFTAAELADLLQRNAQSLRNRFLTPMVDEGLLKRKYPEEPTRPDQSYTSG